MLSVEIENKELFIDQCLNWADQFAYVAYLSPNEQEYPKGGFTHCLTVSNHAFSFTPQQAFEQLQALYDQKKWLFGYLGYDLKNEIEALQSSNAALLPFPDIHFFEPEHLIFFDSDQIRIESLMADEIYTQIQSFSAIELEKYAYPFQASETENEYIEKIHQLRQHIIEGDIYELNYCMAFTAERAPINPLSVFKQLNKRAPAPFSSFLKIKSQYLLCASPERFLKKTGSTLLSQPIKGTAPRFSNSEQDQKSKTDLYHNEKERAENMMIVDLVRNDLARSAVIGSVSVPELFGIYSFSHVHQMISTVQAKLHPDVHPIVTIKNAFPMGSMTGAPKIRAMQLIDQYESFKRGLFSGALGYIDPAGDFDFNVVIRSVFHDKISQQTAFCAGSAITYDSIPEKEFAECLLKTQHIRSILS